MTFFCYSLVIWISLSLLGIADSIDCTNNPEVCDHQCTNTDGTDRCICDEGYEIQDDEKTCKAKDGEALLIYSTRNSTHALYLESEEYVSIGQDLQKVVGISTRGDNFYWLADVSIASGARAAMYRSHWNGSKEEIISSGIGIPEDIAVDWITGNIYFTDSLYGHIRVCNNNGSQCTTIINGTSNLLHGLALYPQNGQLFWSDGGENPHISTASMDGSGNKLLITENLGWPHDLTIDYPKKRLYWVDASRKVIESAKLDGTDRREVLCTAPNPPYSIAIFGSKIYWNDWRNKSIQYAHKSSGNDRTTLVQEQDNIYGFHIHHSALEPNISNPCETTPCSQLCLLAVNRTYSCACTVNHVLNADGHSCDAIPKIEQPLIVTKSTLD